MVGVLEGVRDKKGVRWGRDGCVKNKNTDRGEENTIPKHIHSGQKCQTKENRNWVWGTWASLARGFTMTHIHPSIKPPSLPPYIHIHIYIERENDKMVLEI